MDYSLLSGTVSNYQHSTETTGRIQTTGDRVHGSIQTSHSMSFRIDNKPVLLKQMSMISLGNGDVVTAVGKQTDAGFGAIALRNETAGTFHSLPMGFIIPMLYISLGFMALIALMCLGVNIIFGLIVGALCGWGGYKLWTFVMDAKKAIQMLHDAPSRTAERT